VQGVAQDFLVAAESALELVGRVEVVQRWSDPSALPDMSVGALAAHLASQVLSVHAAVTAGHGASDEVPVPLLEHYSRAAWVRAGVDDEPNVRIREGAAHSAASGHDALTSSLQQAIRDLRTAFASAELPPRIRMPGWDWALSFDDYLVTRVMEIVVHSDDLAVSVGVEPPVLPEVVLGPVLALLVGVSLQRHGQASVVRALTRRERAPNTIAAF
jgi:hypothetical protein